MTWTGGWKIAHYCLLGLAIFSTSSLRADEPITHRILCADSAKSRIAILDEAGKVEWEHKIGPLHDLHLLSNGNVLMQTSWTDLVEIEPASGKIAWQYNSATANGNAGKPVEVHAFQRLDNGNTMMLKADQLALSKSMQLVRSNIW